MTHPNNLVPHRNVIFKNWSWLRVYYYSTHYVSVHSLSSIVLGTGDTVVNKANISRMFKSREDFLPPTLDRSSWREYRCLVLLGVRSLYYVMAGKMERDAVVFSGLYRMHQSIVLSSQQPLLRGHGTLEHVQRTRSPSYWWKSPPLNQSFSTSALLTFVGQIFFVRGRETVLHIVRQEAESLTNSSHWMPVPSPFPVVTTKKVSLHSPVSLGK